MLVALVSFTLAALVLVVLPGPDPLVVVRSSYAADADPASGRPPACCVA